MEHLRKFPTYSLPKIYGWHLMARQDFADTGKIYKYFGANWWDLLYTGKLPLYKGEITIKTKNISSLVFINIGKSPVKMTNLQVGDVYNVIPKRRSLVNNTFDKDITFVSDSPENTMYLTLIGSLWIILLNVQEVASGESLVKNSTIFGDFLLMCGIPDSSQYLTTVGLESFPMIEVQGWEMIENNEGAGKLDFTEYLLEQWKVCNPRKKSYAQKSIPKKVHWIWIRKDVKKKEYGELNKKFFKFMDTWITRNEDFEFNLWTDNPDFILPKKYENRIKIRGPNEIEKVLSKLPTENSVQKNIKYLYYNHGNVGARSDTLRQCLLYLIGGIYADINDASCLAPMEKMCEKFDFIIGLEPVMYVNNAIIGSRKGHIINKSMIAWLASNSRKYVSEWEEDLSLDDVEQEERDDYIVSTTGPIALSSVIFGVLDKNPNKLKDSLILPSAWVYPNYWVPESPELWLKPVSITGHFDARDYLKS